MSLTVIYAPPGFGKTVLMSHFLTQACFDEERDFSMRAEILSKNQSGFNIPFPQNCVSANYSLNMFQTGEYPQKARLINPFRLGFKNSSVDTHFNFPYEIIGIDEAQIYLNSRMSLFYPAWQSRWYEAHRHNNLDIYLATQRPGLIDVNIRELSEFIEVIDLHVKEDIFGDACRLVWDVRHFAHMRLYDKYTSSGGLDKKCYKEKEIVANYNVFDVYDSQSCKPRFYDGYLKYVESGVEFDSSSIDYSSPPISDESALAYLKYLEDYPDEYPEGFYSKPVFKKTVKNKKVS